MTTVTPISLKELYIRWDNVIGDEFKLLRSTSPHDGFEVIADSLVVPFYIDDAVNLFDPAIRYYYKVISLSGGVEVEETETFTFIYHKADQVAHKVIHESRVVLRVMDNPPVYVLLKKRKGEPCPDCWNTITKKVRFANCKTCNGTGELSGYYASVPVRISQNVPQLVSNADTLDGDQTSLTPIDAWVSNYPLLSPGDVIVDVMNQRYSVERVAPRTKNQYVMRQLLQLYPLPKGHPAYNAHVDFGVMPT